MAQATDVTTAPERPAGASAAPPARLARDPKTGRLLPRAAVSAETPVDDEPERHAMSDMDEAMTVSPVPPEEEEDDGTGPAVPEHPETPEPSEDDEDDAPEQPELPVGTQALTTQGSARSRVQALLAEALRLGEAHHLLERQPDGSILLAGQTRHTRRATSDCTCQACRPHDQRHWWCVVCGSGPHDWMLVKPQYERQTLKPGGIEGARQAACSAQCARDFLSSLGRQPSGVPTGTPIDPTLALPSQ